MPPASRFATHWLNSVTHYTSRRDVGEDEERCGWRKRVECDVGVAENSDGAIVDVADIMCMVLLVLLGT